MNSGKKAARYSSRVTKALEKALEDAGTPVVFDASQERLIIFSDQHKGVRDNADDFARSERAYNAALAYYFERGYTLVELGDVEELWENKVPPVLDAYHRTTELEADFHRAGRYRRVWGNHDDLWEFSGPVAKYLHEWFPSLKVPQSILFSVRDDGAELGRMLLLHGHQGEVCSDSNRKIARWVVRYLWRPFQRTFGGKRTTPATDWSLRDGHNRVLHSWAQTQERFVLVAGHTHQPIFESVLHEARLARQLREAQAAGEADTVATTRAELEWVLAQNPRESAVFVRELEVHRPAYFNTGCCSYADGDITGIEIGGGQIRLVRWPNDQNEPKPKILEQADIKAVFDACA